LRTEGGKGQVSKGRLPQMAARSFIGAASQLSATARQLQDFGRRLLGPSSFTTCGPNVPSDASGAGQRNSAASFRNGSAARVRSPPSGLRYSISGPSRCRSQMSITGPPVGPLKERMHTLPSACLHFCTQMPQLARNGVDGGIPREKGK